MADLSDLMQTFAENAEKLVVPDQAKRKAMTAAGAKVFAEALQEETRSHHFRAGRKIGKVKHLADSITSENKDIDGVDNGNSIVGFTGRDEGGINHARVARFLNDGTKFIDGDGFVDRVRKDSAEAVFAAERMVYEEGGHAGGATHDTGPEAD